MSLEEILQDYFEVEQPFKKDGDFSKDGLQAYNKLIDLLHNINKLTGENLEWVIRELDRIAGW